MEEIEPKVRDFFKVCRTLGITIEWAVAGDEGQEYVKNVIRNNPKSIQVPDRILPIVERLLLLDDRDLSGIMANVAALTKDKKGKQGKAVTTDNQKSATG